MSSFERQLPSYRLVAINHGDDLASIASREMGDANRWQELVWINELAHPYITTDERRAGAGVLLAGGYIKVPAPAGVWTDDAERGQVYERDCAMVRRQLGVDESGDIAVFSGADNLRQQLQHRIDTPRGQAKRHPGYGCAVSRLVGSVTGPTAGILAAEYVKSAIASDYRISRVDSSVAQVQGDAIRVTARAVAIEGSVIDLVTNY
jgi:phage baseplate assembly protein W